jgi:hypothetical protein
MTSSKILNLDMLVDFENRRVLHTDFLEGEELLDDLIKLSPKLQNAYIVTFFAHAGLGKSTLLLDLQARNPPYPKKDKIKKGTIIPVPTISAEENCSVRKVVDSLCHAVGKSTTTSANATYLKKKAIEALKDVGAVALAIDEAQEFLNNSNRSGVKSVVSFVRSLAESIKIPLILMGTPCYEDFVYASDAMNRRVKTSHHLRIMDSPIDDKTQFYRTSEGMLDNLQLVTGRTLCESVDRLEFSQRLFIVSGGRIGCIYDFLAQYIKDQEKSGSTKTTFDLEDCLKVLKRYRAPFPLIQPSTKAFKVSPKDLSGLMIKYESMEDHV